MKQHLPGPHPHRPSSNIPGKYLSSNLLKQ